MNDKNETNEIKKKKGPPFKYDNDFDRLEAKRKVQRDCYYRHKTSNKPRGRPRKYNSEEEKKEAIKQKKYPKTLNKSQLIQENEALRRIIENLIN